MKQQQLTRSESDKMVSGVAAGLAHFLNIDPVFVRLFFAIFAISNPLLGILAYVLLSIIMPADHTAEAIYNGFNEDEIVIKDS